MTDRLGFKELSRRQRRLDDLREKALTRPALSGYDRTYIEPPTRRFGPSFEQNAGRALMGGTLLPASLATMLPSMGLRAGLIGSGIASAGTSETAEDAGAGGGLSALALPGAAKALAPLAALGAASYAPEAEAVIVPKGAKNWLKGTVEDALRGLKKRTPTSRQDLMEELAGYRPGSASAQRVQGELDQLTAIEPFNSWIDNQLTGYVKNRMASPSDEIMKSIDDFKPEGFAKGGAVQQDKHWSECL